MPSLHVMLVLLPFVLPIAIWVAWSDMKFMKIPNKAVLTMLAVWALVGWIAVPFNLYLWGFALAVILLVVGFVANASGLLGAGDAKFAAAMAPFFVGGDLRVILALFAACLIGAFATHRIARALPPIRRMTADWASWTHPKFPMGLALSGVIVFYLLAALLPKG